jgi:hypothetical protein
MRRSKSKTPSANGKSNSTPSGPRVDWVPPHPALGAQVIIKQNILFYKIFSSDNSY